MGFFFINPTSLDRRIAHNLSSHGISKAQPLNGGKAFFV
ncbi:hypothetical protein C8K15_10918 [Paenisporosarcina sp. OV554]|nr:hypothetical protein C8K15_10918 [Paenisporosarcina sp. OV554]